MKKYDLLYIDPPWFYNSRKAGGEMKNKSKFGGGAMKHYGLMKDKELLDFKNIIDSYSKQDSIMFMWVTMPRLDFGIELLKHYGFNYKTVAYSWVKTTKNGNYRYNPGYYTASNIELCIIGIKGKNNGKFKPKKAMINQIIAEPIREHSRKPEKVVENIESMYPNLEKIEIFARTTRKNWGVFGNQTNKF